MLRSTRFVAITLLIAVLVSACAPAATPVAPAAPVIQTIVVPGATQIVVVQATPAPGQPTPLPAGSITLNGAGATFPDPIYSEWRFAYQYVDPSVVINYQAIGSGGGKKGIVDGTIDFAGSDSLLTTEYTATTKGQLQMFPTVAGAIVMIVNLAPEVTKTIVLDGPTLVGIYSAKITNWNDPAIAALNSGVAFPDKPISVVHRSDGSGTTENFTKFLAAVSADWKSTVGAGQAVQWPVDKAGSGVGGKGNAGVAAAVQNTPYSIGYVEAAFAVANKISFADMINVAGKKVTANVASLQAAMTEFGDAFDPAKLTIYTMSNGKSDGAWPINAYTYQIVYMDWKSDATLGCLKATKYLNWVHWFLTDAAAAKRATDLGYATLPDSVRTKVLATLAKVTCDGKPVDSDISMK